MNMRHRTGALTCLLFAALHAGFAAEAPPAPPATGITMRIQQDIALGDLSCTTDYRAQFLPPTNFRVEGAMRIKAMEMTLKNVIIGEGSLVKQLSDTPMGPKAYVVDLDRIRKALPEADYSPSKTYDPAVYMDMVRNTPDKKSLPPEKLDGVETEGYELPLPEGRVSLKANVALALPDPVKARVWLNPKDGVARKVELEDAKGATFLRTLYTEVKTNTPIPATAFDMTFPQGVAPEDITDIVLGGVIATRRPPPANKLK
jgi:hypothetical protein